MKTHVLSDGTLTRPTRRGAEITPVSRVAVGNPGIHCSSDYYSPQSGFYRVHRRVTHKQLCAARNSRTVRPNGRFKNSICFKTFLGCLPVFGVSCYNAC